jgi:zinc-ribbon domain
MYCPACGKSVPDGSNFCLHCGSSMIAPKAAVEWEYRDFVWAWKPGQGGKFWLGDPSLGPDENAIRLTNWNQDQSKILPKIQEWLDNSWEPITQIGPAAYSFRHHRGGIFDSIWGYLECAEFSAYPNNPEARKAMRAQAKWRNAREFSPFLSQRINTRRKRFLHLCVRSTPHRRARAPACRLRA